MTQFTDLEHQDHLQDKAIHRTPPMYRVFLLNDDYTSMEFVVDVLRFFFDMDEEKATQVMLKVHNQGKGLCGVYSHDVAQTKAHQVNEYAREHENPLLCTIEQIHE